MAPKRRDAGPTPPERAELSDSTGGRRSIERAAEPTNPLPFARGNTTERIDSGRRQGAARSVLSAPAPPSERTTRGDGVARTAVRCPRRRTRCRCIARPNRRRPQPRGPSPGVLAEAIRNVQKYVGTGVVATTRRAGGPTPSSRRSSSTRRASSSVRGCGASSRRSAATGSCPTRRCRCRGTWCVTFNVHKRRPHHRPAGREALVGRRVHELRLQRARGVEPDDPAAAGVSGRHAPFFTVTFYFNETPDR